MNYLADGSLMFKYLINNRFTKHHIIKIIIQRDVFNQNTTNRIQEFFSGAVYKSPIEKKRRNCNPTPYEQKYV